MIFLCTHVILQHQSLGINEVSSPSLQAPTPMTIVWTLALSSMLPSEILYSSTLLLTRTYCHHALSIYQFAFSPRPPKSLISLHYPCQFYHDGSPFSPSSLVPGIHHFLHSVNKSLNVPAYCLSTTFPLLRPNLG